MPSKQLSSPHRPHNATLTAVNRRQERRRLRAALRRAARRPVRALDRVLIGLGARLRALWLLPMGGYLEPNGDGSGEKPRIERRRPETECWPCEAAVRLRAVPFVADTVLGPVVVHGHDCGGRPDRSRIAWIGRG